MKTMNFKEVFELADTQTDTSNISDFAGQLWTQQIVKYGEALRRLDQGCAIYNELVGTGAVTLTVPKSTSHKDVDTAKSGGEAAVRDHTALDNLDGVDFTIAVTDFKQGDVTVTKAAEMSTMIDLVGQARYVVAEALAQDVDTALATAMQSTNVTNVLWGGDATGVDSLETGDVLTTDLIANAMQQIEANNFVPNLLFVNTKQIRELRKDSQFVNASEYGSDRVVMRGEIGEYLGLNVISTTNVPTYSATATDTNESSTLWAVAGNTCIMTGQNKMGANVGPALVWKEMPKIGYEYEMEKNLHHVYYDQTFKAGIVQPGAMSLIKVAQD